MTVFVDLKDIIALGLILFIGIILFIITLFNQNDKK